MTNDQKQLELLINFAKWVDTQDKSGPFGHEAGLVLMEVEAIKNGTHADFIKNMEESCSHYSFPQPTGD